MLLYILFQLITGTYVILYIIYYSLRHMIHLINFFQCLFSTWEILGS